MSSKQPAIQYYLSKWQSKQGRPSKRINSNKNSDPVPVHVNQKKFHVGTKKKAIEKFIKVFQGNQRHTQYEFVSSKEQFYLSRGKKKICNDNQVHVIPRDVPRDVYKKAFQNFPLPMCIVRFFSI